MHGFTCSIDDLLLTPAAEASRAERIRTAENEVGDRVHATFGGVAAKDQVSDFAAQFSCLFRRSGWVAPLHLEFGSIELKLLQLKAAAFNNAKCSFCSARFLELSKQVCVVL